MYGAQKYHEKFDELKVRVPSGEGNIFVCMQQDEVKQSTISSTEQQKKTIERDKQK